MGQHVIIISPDGSEAKTIYSDDLPLREIGELELERASNVVFNHLDQLWHVVGSDGVMLNQEGFERRDDAIKKEIAVLQDILDKGDGTL